MKEITIILDGSKIHDIVSFYSEVNSVIMANENWKLGSSLDAFDDMLYGGYGALKECDHVRWIWKESEKNRQDLGYEITRSYYLDKLKPGSPFSHNIFRQKLAELESGRGQTYFDILLEILESHQNIDLIMA